VLSFAGPMPEEYEMYYGFTRFAMELNELDPDMAKYLPITDTRFRPDQRYANDCLLLFILKSFISSTGHHIFHNVKHTDFKAYLTKYPSDLSLDGPWSKKLWQKQNMLFLLAIEPQFQVIQPVGVYNWISMFKFHTQNAALAQTQYLNS
jgi:hypothetical protein